MHNVTFDFSSFHNYGTAFYDYLGLRKQVFVDQLDWGIPHDGMVEMDQYDTPQARYSVVLKGGRVVGGAREMPTTASWGPHTYMLRDAHRGLLAEIPADVMPEDIVSPQVWECTRLVISDSLRSHRERAECLSLIVDGLVAMARGAGASQLICLSSLALMRALRQVGYEVSRIGPTYQNGEDGRRYAVLSMPATYSTLYHEMVEAEAPLQLSA